jgi:hypothetical protein
LLLGLENGDVENSFTKDELLTKERFGRTAVMQLQQQYLAVQAKLDQAYDDRLAGRITDELRLRKSAEWEAELGTIRRETARHERATHDQAATGSKILELAKNAQSVHSAGFTRTGASAENTDIELDVLSRKPFSCLR